ncbi:MAG TPA: DNA-processing protein DprA [Rubrobacteraceae bacterium]|nr:DNA-processing protein DprA [Rubrobacteraceae bacterium]
MTARGRAAYLFLSLLQARVGTSVISRLGDLAPEAVPEMSSGELAARIKLTERARQAFDDLKRTFDAETVERRLSEKGIRAVTLADEDYPERLREVPDAPPALFVNGALPAGPAVAVVGSRKCSVSGIEVARELGRALGGRGVCVVSGLALGIDAAAHEGTLMADGPTVGVLGCGIDVIYPRRNRDLYARVSTTGAVLSEYYLGEAPLAWRFPARNRIIAGLAETLVVVEAAEKSGALITARHALDSGRDVWAVPGPVGVAECRGSNKLLSEGAGVLWDIREFVDAVAPVQETLPQRGEARSEDLPAGLPEREAAVLAGVGFEPTEVDVISSRSGIGMRDLLPALTMLELKGYVGRNVSGAFVRRSTV